LKTFGPRAVRVVYDAVAALSEPGGELRGVPRQRGFTITDTDRRINASRPIAQKVHAFVRDFTGPPSKRRTICAATHRVETQLVAVPRSRPQDRPDRGYGDAPAEIEVW